MFVLCIFRCFMLFNHVLQCFTVFTRACVSVCMCVFVCAWECMCLCVSVVLHSVLRCNTLYIRFYTRGHLRFMFVLWRIRCFVVFTAFTMFFAFVCV